MHSSVRPGDLSLVSILAFSCALIAQSPGPGLATGPMTSPSNGHATTQFVPNLGQWHQRALARATARGIAAWIADTSLTLDLAGADDQRCVVELAFVGGHADQSGLRPQGERTGVHHYYLGDADSWRRDVPVYASLTQQGIWPGVDLVLRADRGELAYDLACSSDASLGGIVFEVRGAEQLLLDADGSLRIRTAIGDLVQSAPVSWHEDTDGDRTPTASHFRLLGSNRFGFDAGIPQPGMRLVIDPVLHWGTFVGGTGDDSAMDVAPMANGTAALVGTTRSANFPLSTGPVQGTQGGLWDAFVSRFDPTQTGASQLLWSTFLGGSGDDAALALRVTPAGDIWLTGYAGANAPTTANAFQTVHGGSLDAYVASLNAQGQLRYATYFGGALNDHASCLRIAADGTTVTFAGNTESGNLPVAAGACQPTFGGLMDAYIARLDTAQPAALQLTFGTYLGGPGTEGNAVATSTPWNFQDSGLVVDANGSIFHTGNSSGGFPTTAGSYQPVYTGTSLTSNVTVTRLDPSATGASQLVWSTYIGGSVSWSESYSMDLSPRGTLILGGLTYDPTFPTTAGAFRTTMDPTVGPVNHDAFVAELSTDGSQLLYSTLLGSVNNSTGGRAAVEPSGTVLCAGFTRALLPVTTGARTPTPPSPGVNDVYIARLDLRGQGNADLLHLTYFGGSSGEGCWGLAVGTGGSAWICGIATSLNLPVSAGAFQTTNRQGPRDAWAARIDLLPVGVARVGTASPGCASNFALLPFGGPSLAANDFGVQISGASANSLTLLLVGDLRSRPLAPPGLGVLSLVAHGAPMVGWTDGAGGRRVPLPLSGATVGLGFAAEAWCLGGCAPVMVSDTLAVTVQL
jgi:hypothetical protein